MPAERPLSRAQARMLEAIRDFGDPYYHIAGTGQSRHGGAAGTIASLHRRKLILSKTTRGRYRYMLTLAGREALIEYLRRVDRFGSILVERNAMSRSRHVRPPRQRTDPNTSPKKPDAGRRWRKRNILAKKLPPRDVRKLPPVDE